MIVRKIGLIYLKITRDHEFKKGHRRLMCSRYLLLAAFQFSLNIRLKGIGQYT